MSKDTARHRVLLPQIMQGHASAHSTAFGSGRSLFMGGILSVCVRKHEYGPQWI